jgi:hypothetical protein
MPVSLASRALAALALGIAPALAGEPAPAAPSPSVAQVGINLSGFANQTDVPFKDAFLLSREWAPCPPSARGWNRLPEPARVDVDERGWLKALPAGTGAMTLIPGYRSLDADGQYVCLHEGEGEMEFFSFPKGDPARVVSRAPGRLVLQFTPGAEIFLRIASLRPENPIRNLHLVKPAFEKDFLEDPFHPEFLKRWGFARVLRFMDWMETNGSPLREWKDRPRLGDARYRKGVPLELLLDLGNRTGAAPWLCVPHLAEDSFVEEMARLAKERLDPRLGLYLEYSNEVWNWQFAQSRHALERGRALGLDPADKDNHLFYYARRSREIFAIWDRVFGRSPRVVRVLSSHAALPATTQKILAFEDAARHADAVAVAPYMSWLVSPPPAPPGADKRAEPQQVEAVAGWDLDRAFAHLRGKVLPETLEVRIRQQAAVARKHGLPLVAYEGGQHFLCIRSANQNDAAVRLLCAVNRDPRMEALYEDYLRAWKDEGGGLFCHFASLSRYGQFGSWGLAERLEDLGAPASPKFNALRRAADSWRQPAAAP